MAFLLSLIASLLFLLSSMRPSNSLALANSGGSFPPPIVYTIAGSDSGGGAGIQADLLTMKDMQCHGCSAITCLTAQNSVGVTDVFAPPASFLETQLDTLISDLPPKAIKIGMLGTKELAETVGKKLKSFAIDDDDSNSSKKVWVVLDPVMISTSGHKLIDDDAKNAMIQHVFPHTDILTPNKFEAEALLGRKLESYQDVEQGARELLDMGVKSVLIKGGHTLTESSMDESCPNSSVVTYAQDFFMSSEAPGEEERVCDGNRGVWLRVPRYDTEHTHGTGCTLSSAIASALALGQQRRELVAEFQDEDHYEGATSAIQLTDACCLAKAYVTAGIHAGLGLGKGPGPVRHTEFPSSYAYFPTIPLHPDEDSSNAFIKMKSAVTTSGDDDTITLGRILPIVDTVEWVERLAKVDGVTDIQLRIKDETDPEKIYERCKLCQQICEASNVRLWINDFWEAALRAKCFGVHIGQEDLVKCSNSGGIQKLRENNIALGISTHSYGELSAALGIRPSYISLGPVFATSSKNVQFDPQGLNIVNKWRQLIPPDIPLVAIGGINNAKIAEKVKHVGADCVAVIGAITASDDVDAAVQGLNDAMT